MKILEQFIKGKKQDQNLCEDGLYISDDFIAVIDGVTAKSQKTFFGKAGGRAGMEKAKEVIGGLPYSIDGESAVELINQGIKTLYEGEPTGEAAVCLMIYSKYKNEIWALGDCQCLVNGEFFSDEKEIDSILADVRALVLELSRIEGADEETFSENDPGRAYIMPILQKQHLLSNSNSKFGYGVLNGTPLKKGALKILKVNKGDTVVLASDGYPKIFNTLKESEDYLAFTIENNPLCDGDYRSTKGIVKGNSSFDDRTYIRFEV
ncbi:MAG: hypothetical protein ACI4IF_07495 [Acutalibacteraceae bacterium]